MKKLLITGLLLSGAGSVMADEVITQELVVQQSVCVGAECQDGEVFGFETLKVKSASPQMLFDDTSSSAAFPSNDWQVGVSDEIAGDQASFFIEDATGNRRVFEASPSGDVALGSSSAIVQGAVSVGSEDIARRVVYVADATADTDAVNLRTAQSIASTLDVSSEAAELDAAIEALNARLSDLSDRITALEP
ncbi:hypothetical protein [Thalassolituus sp.]|jgi:hypothetical protein|uniref:hypothetical protein n=1 Tax=Thalassolituus sp. TaxID=2030822 RepID=UPI003514FC33